MSNLHTRLMSLLGIGSLALLTLVACSASTAASTAATATSQPSATPTSPATVTSCAQLPTFASASPVGDFYSLQFPASTVANGVTPATPATGQFGVVTGSFCTANTTTQLTITGGKGPEPFVTALLFEGWANATTFPTDGYLQKTCATGMTCFSNTGNNDFLVLQNVVDHGNGIVSYQLAHATAPTAPSCNSNFASSPTPGIILFLTDFVPPVPLPPVSRTVPDSAAGLTGIDICSAGTAASVTTFMTTYLAATGYTKVASDSRCFYMSECWSSPSSAISFDVTDPTLWHVAFHQTPGSY